MDITYKPYIRDSAFKELSIKNPTIDITGYKPKYTTEQTEQVEETEPVKQEKVTPVESQIEEIRMRKPQVEETSPKTTVFKSKKEFQDTMTPIYETLLIKRGLNPAFAKSLVAQDGLESAWGSKPSGDFNFGGIKGKGSIKNTREVINGQDVYIKDSFRNFNSLEDYASFKINLLNNNRYRAFSGDISEFADRVSKGGYATDPNYSKILNKIIASAKHGGTLKLQQGGLAESKEWVKNWYKNRKPQIRQNILANDSLPFNSLFGYNLLIRNINLAKAHVNPDRVPIDANGVYYPNIHTIYLREDSPSVGVHEWVHSSKPNAQVKEIEKIKDILGDAFYDRGSIIPDSYLDDPHEIYSRLMQLRHTLNIDPNHKFTNEEVEALKRDRIKQETLTNRLKGKNKNNFSTTVFDKDGKVIEAEPFDPDYKYVPEESTINREYDNTNSFFILNRYSTDTIRRLLNDVAQMPKKKDSTIYARLGLKIPKYQYSGVLRNAYNDPNHYYDYSKGTYDKSTGHWNDRDPKTGMELKNPNHPTAFMHHEVEQQLGNKRYQDDNGKYYTFPEGKAPIWRNTYGLLSKTPGLKEVEYPSYGENKSTMEASIKGNIPRIKWIWNEFINAGATPEQAAAILGNFWKESRINPLTDPSSAGASGIAQLLGERLNRYKEFLNKNNLIDSTESQIKYLIPIIFSNEVNPHNLDNNYNSFITEWTKPQRNKFRKAKGLDNITIEFANQFERMEETEADFDTRKKAARYIYNLMTK